GRLGCAVCRRVRRFGGRECRGSLGGQRRSRGRGRGGCLRRRHPGRGRLGLEHDRRVPLTERQARGGGRGLEVRRGVRRRVRRRGRRGRLGGRGRGGGRRLGRRHGRRG